MSNSMVSDVGQSNTLYLSIADGNIVQKVKEGNTDPRVVAREYKTKGGDKGTAYEIPFKDLHGFITKIAVEDGKFGTQCRVHLALGDDRVILTLGYESRYFDDFAKRIAGADLSKPVTLNAYSFTNDDGRLVQGVTVEQDGEKLGNYFYDAEKKKALHGIPDVDKKTAAKYEKEDWKIHFLAVRRFLKGVVTSLNFSDHNTLPGESGTSMTTDTLPKEKEAELPEGVEKLPWQ